MTRKTSPAWLALVLCGLACSSGASRFEGADRIDLWTLDLDTGARIVTAVDDRGEVDALVALITLEGQHHCGCEHLEGLTIHRGGEATDISICDHCFEIEGEADYDMPPAFYAAYRRYIPTREGR